MNKEIQDRLSALRSEMKALGINYYMMPTADYHNSEYVNDFFKVREYFCGFTGSNGTLIVWQDGAGLWTDGRYFIQAETELSGTGVTLFRMAEEGVPTKEEFLTDHMENGQILGFDGRVLSMSEGSRLEEQLLKKGVVIQYEEDLAKRIWTDRPILPCGKAWSVKTELAGKSVCEKISDVREGIKKARADALLLTKLDDLMWLFNIRGCDVECNPVALSYGFVDASHAILFIQKKATDPTLLEELKGYGVEVQDYEMVGTFLENSELIQGSILLDDRHCNYTIYKKLSKRINVIKEKNPTELLKARKNPVELANMEKVYLLDSVAVTKFIYWLKHNVGKLEITEVTAADYLEQLRRKIPEFLDLSFPTIAGYKENAAMMHYKATEDHCKKLEPEGMLLVDSGGQYLGGTTDVTRTIVLGEISDEIKSHYTAVVSGVMQLTHAKWLHGCTGRNLDILCRQPLWNKGIEYKCGTGHGVGYILNVHEGPQNMRWRFLDGMTEAVIDEGMDITNEPGVYIEGSHGIRVENVMVAKNDIKNGDGQFMHFDTLTFVPIDREAIAPDEMTRENLAFLNEYHQKVYEKLTPYLSEEEREWLKKATRPIQQK